MEWTNADAKRAAKEGWKLLGRYVARAYDHLGRCPFHHTFDVVEFLRNKGKKSEWHKQVYMWLPWTGADDQIAVSEGWRLTHHSILTNGSGVFGTHDAAREYVVTHAQAGDPLCIKALSTLAKYRLTYGD